MVKQLVCDTESLCMSCAKMALNRVALQPVVHVSVLCQTSLQSGVLLPLSLSVVLLYVCVAYRDVTGRRQRNESADVRRACGERTEAGRHQMTCILRAMRSCGCLEGMQIASGICAAKWAHLFLAVLCYRKHCQERIGCK